MNAAQKACHTGAVSASAFQCDAIYHGLHAAKPFEDHLAYDFLVDNGQRVLRIQVKGSGAAKAYHGRGSRWRFNVKSSPQAVGTIDYYAFHLAGARRWLFLRPDELAVTGTFTLAASSKMWARLDNWKDLKT